MLNARSVSGVIEGRAGRLDGNWMFLARPSHESDRQIISLGKLFYKRDDIARHKPSGARVKADCERTCLLIWLRNQPVEKANRKVVDDLPAQIFQHSQRGRFAGTRQTCDQQNTLLVRAGP